jgi:hypothetical protein
MNRTRQRIWDEMALHEPLDFEKGYMVLHTVYSHCFCVARKIFAQYAATDGQQGYDSKLLLIPVKIRYRQTEGTRL